LSVTPAAPSARFISLEGGEGAGKSTQLRLLSAWLQGRGIKLVATREPGGSPGAEEIRALLVTGATGRWDPLTETLLHYAARRTHVESLVLPALRAGQWVVSDRFADSTLAYQGYGLGVDLQAIERLRELAIGAFRPDLTIVLDVPPATRRARTAGRAGNEDRYERMSEPFHARVRDGFLAIAASDPGRCVVIDADLPADIVAARIQHAIAVKCGDPRLVD
jgi:dTMP kinase